MRKPHIVIEKIPEGYIGRLEGVPKSESENAQESVDDAVSDVVMRFHKEMGIKITVTEEL